VARKRKQDEEEAARRQEEEAAMSGLRVELQSLRGSDSDMTLLTAMEFVTSDPRRSSSASWPGRKTKRGLVSRSLPHSRVVLPCLCLRYQAL
jgi:hypothetical protein